MMDGTPSRHVSFSLQVEETTTDDEILLYNRCHGTCDSMNGEMDRPETIFGIEEGLESGNSNTGNVQPGSPRNDGVNKANIQLFYREVCEMGARCFTELCFVDFFIAFVLLFLVFFLTVVCSLCAFVRADVCAF